MHQCNVLSCVALRSHSFQHGRPFSGGCANCWGRSHGFARLWREVTFVKFYWSNSKHASTDRARKTASWPECQLVACWRYLNSPFCFNLRKKKRPKMEISGRDTNRFVGLATVRRRALTAVRCSGKLLRGWFLERILTGRRITYYTLSVKRIHVGIWYLIQQESVMNQWNAPNHTAKKEKLHLEI
jgi:hypothetical protein